MKKILLLLAGAVVALSFVSCDKARQYQALGEEMARQLDELVAQQDTAAVLALDKTIHEKEEEVVALGDTAAIARFREALKDSRQRNAPYITALKVKNGLDTKKAVQEVIDDVMDGDIDIQAVTSSIDEVLKQDEENKK